MYINRHPQFAGDRPEAPHAVSIAARHYAWRTQASRPTKGSGKCPINGPHSTGVRRATQWLGAALAALTLLLAPTAARADTAAAPNAPYTWGHAVANLDATVHFYHDVLGLELVRPVPRYSRPDPQYARLTGTPGARYRSALLRVPNVPFLLEFTEYSGVPRQQVQANEADPGAAALTLSVKDAASAYQALRDAHTPTLLPGGVIPSPTGNGGATVFVRDPDGYIVDVVQRTTDWFTIPVPTITDGPGMRYVISGQLDLTVASVAQTLPFYRDALGFDISAGFPPLVGPGIHPGPPFLTFLFGITPGSTWGADTGSCTTTLIRCEYYEYDDPARKTFNPPIQDPGAPIETIRTQDLNALLPQLVAAGAQIVTPGQRPVRVDGVRSIIVRDPSGFLIRLEQRGDDDGHHDH